METLAETTGILAETMETLPDTMEILPETTEFLAKTIETLVETMETLTETMVPVGQHVESVEVFMHLVADYMFQTLRKDRGEGYRTVIPSRLTVPFLKDWGHVGVCPILWQNSAVQRFLEKDGYCWREACCTLLKNHVRDIIRPRCFVWLNLFQ